jgi:PIN domain nuclease of toxin-antitoxin system
MTSGLLILDTHIWIWAINGNVDRLSTEGLKAIETASQNNQLGVCAISVWEVGMLESKGRVQLGKVCLDWVRDALSAPGLRLLPLTPEIAILKATLVTKDLKLLDYASQSFMSAIGG